MLNFTEINNLADMLNSLETRAFRVAYDGDEGSPIIPVVDPSEDNGFGGIEKHGKDVFYSVEDWEPIGQIRNDAPFDPQAHASMIQKIGERNANIWMVYVGEGTVVYRSK